MMNGCSFEGAADVNLYSCPANTKGMSVGTITYSFQWNQPCSLLKTAKIKTQHNSKWPIVPSFTEKYDSSFKSYVIVSYKSLLQPVVHQVFPLLRSLASDNFIYAERHHRLQVCDENFFWGLHTRPVGCFTCHALEMWSNTAHDVHSISPSHLSCHSPLYRPIKQTSQEIKKMPLKWPQLAKAQCQSQWCHKLHRFQYPLQ